MLRLTIIALVL